MSKNLQLKVFEIFRSRKISSTFFILTKENLYRVNQSMYGKILQGYVYKNDIIKITNEDEKGIIFEIVDNEEINCKFDFSYNDYIYHKYNLLPFLVDILPYQDREVEYLPSSASPNLSGTILYKTRINYTNTSQYIFFILKIKEEFIKAIIWKENLKYSSLEVGDKVGITKFKKAKGYPPKGHVEYNEFSEMGLFNTNEITIYEMYKMRNSEDINEIQSKYNSFLHDIKGYINYRSVLNRRNNNGYNEYYLLNVGEEKVMLFYNSDLDFYEIEAGNKIEIYNLRKLKRNNLTIYVSTIFTQFKYENIAEYNEECSTFLNEIPNKRRIEDIYENTEVKKRKKDLDIENLDMTSEDIMHLTDDNTVTLNLEIITPDKQKTQKMDDIFSDSILKKSSFIESAYGFLPDCFDEVNEDFIFIDNLKISVSPFFTPRKLKIEELDEFSKNLVINENEKVLIEGKVLDIKNLKDLSEVFINYIDTNIIKNQYPITVYIENCPPIYIFENFFALETNDLAEKVSKLLGKTCFIILNVFRASLDCVVYSISDIKNK